MYHIENFGCGFFLFLGIGGNQQSDDRRSRRRDNDDRDRKSVLLVSELNAEVCI